MRGIGYDPIFSYTASDKKDFARVRRNIRDFLHENAILSSYYTTAKKREQPPHGILHAGNITTKNRDCRLRGNPGSASLLFRCTPHTCSGDCGAVGAVGSVGVTGAV